MRKVIYIGQSYCPACNSMLENVVKPLKAKHPDSVSVHYGWDGVMERVNRRKSIKTIPLFVVENEGREEFRYSGKLSVKELSAIIECERDVITLDDVLDGAFK